MSLAEARTHIKGALDAPAGEAEERIRRAREVLDTGEFRGNGGTEHLEMARDVLGHALVADARSERERLLRKALGSLSIAPGAPGDGEERLDDGRDRTTRSEPAPGPRPDERVTATVTIDVPREVYREARARAIELTEVDEAPERFAARLEALVMEYVTLDYRYTVAGSPVRDLSAPDAGNDDG